MSNIQTPTTSIIACIDGIEIDSRNLKPCFSLDEADKVTVEYIY